MTRVDPNPEDRFPAAFGLRAKLGFRAIGEGNLDIENDGLAAFAELHVQYGDPSAPLAHPFDDFLLVLQLNSKDSELIGRLQVEGSLYLADLRRTEADAHQFWPATCPSVRRSGSVRRSSSRPEAATTAISPTSTAETRSCACSPPCVGRSLASSRRASSPGVQGPYTKRLERANRCPSSRGRSRSFVRRGWKQRRVHACSRVDA